MNIIKSEYLRSIAIVLFGTAGVQLVLLIALPIITRIYSPTEYGVYSEYLSYALILHVAFALGLERSLPLSPLKLLKSNAGLLGLMAFAFTLILTVLGSFFFDFEFLIFVLLVSLLMSLSSIFNYYLVAINNFKKESSSRVIQVLSLCCSQLSFGAIWPTSTTLLISDITSRLLIIVYTKPNKIKVFWAESFEFLKRKKSFYSYGLGAALLTAASMNMPVLLIAHFYDAASAGVFFIALKLTTAPITLMGTSISKVYFAKLSTIKCDKLKSEQFFYNNLKKTILFSVILIPVLLILSYLVQYIFSADWGDIGSYILVLLPLSMGQMIFNPISMTNTVYHQQKYDLYFSFFRFFALTIIFIVADHFKIESSLAVLSYSVFMFFAYIFMTYISKNVIESYSFRLRNHDHDK